MWTKLKAAVQAIIGTLAVLMTLILIALVGVAVAFVGYFLIWGLIGLGIISFMCFLLYAWIHENDDLSPKSDSPTD